MNLPRFVSNSLLAAIAMFTCLPAMATPVTYVINFTQTSREHDPSTPGSEWLGPRLLTGEMTIDDSVLGPSHANSSYGPSSPELAAIYSYAITLDSKVYPFNHDDTVAYAFSTVIRTDAAGRIVDLRGAFRLPGTISEVLLGIDGSEGTYIDIQGITLISSVAVSGGTYNVSLMNTVPEPSGFGLTLAGLGFLGIASISRNRLFSDSRLRLSFLRR